MVCARDGSHGIYFRNVNSCRVLDLPLICYEILVTSLGREVRSVRDALVIIGVQVGSFGPSCPPRHDVAALVKRLNELAR